MSTGNVKDRSVVDALRALDDRLRRIESRLNVYDPGTYHTRLKGLAYADAGHTGFASTASLTAHTGDATIHFTEGSIDHDKIVNFDDESHVSIGTSAPGSPILGQLWSNTTGGTVVISVYDGADWLYIMGNA